MNIKFDFLNKKVNLKKKDFFLNPNLFWEMAIFMGFILIIVFSAFGYFIFVNTGKESTPTGTGNDQSYMVDKNRLNKDLNYFANRAEKSTEILKNPAPVVDPSV